MKCVYAFVLFLFSIATFAQTIEIKPYHSFHPSQLGMEYGALEDGSIDEGGILYVYVNNLGLPDSIIDIVLKDSDGDYSSPYGWHSIPGRMDPEHGNYCGLTIKGMEAPLSEGETVTVIITTENDAVDSMTVESLKKPDLQIANLIPSQDHATLKIYVRNDGESAVTLNSLNYNQTVYPIPSAAVEAIGGTTSIAPQGLIILNFNPGYSFETPDPALLSFSYSVDLGDEEQTTAAVRIVHPEFRLGTWHSSAYNPENEQGRIHLRRLGMQSIQGPGNYDLMSDGYERFYYQTIREANFGDPFDAATAYEEVYARRDSSMMDVWIIDDEPDLNGKSIESQLAKYNTYRRADSSTAIYINLAVQKKFQQYGFYSDIVGMDHYAAPNAPNIIPGTWVPIIGRTGEIKESLEYSEVLKANTEPRRNWFWVQFATSTWGVQPDPIVFSYQFWAHIMGGAKSMKYFAANSNSINEFNGNWNSALMTYRRFKQVRNIVLYGEPNGLSFSSNEEVLTGTLIGEEFMSIIALNNSITFEGNVLDGFETSYAMQDYTIDAWVPEWINPEEVYLLTPFGKSSELTYEWIAADTIRISPENPLGAESAIFVIGPSDTTPPAALNGLRFARYDDAENYVFSWLESYDNAGTMGYNVYFNDTFITQTIAPIYEVKNQGASCSGWWKFEPIDNSGNTGEADSLYMVFSGAAASLLEQPTDTAVFVEDSAYFSISANHIGGFQWQCYNTETMTWENLTENETHLGVFSPHLIISSALEEKTYRCVFTNPCDGSQLFSEEAKLTLIDDAGLKNPTIQFSIYPNPGQGTFEIHHNSSNTDEMTVFDLQGKKIMDRKLSVGSDLLTLSNSGIYLLVLTTDAGLVIRRVVVQ